MSFNIYTKRPPYYKLRPKETIIKYVVRVIKNIIQMYPYARIHGIRYFFDTDFRRSISYKRRRMHQDTVRKKRGGAFGRRAKARAKKLLIARDGEQCNTCKTTFEKAALTIDHIIPLFIGGNSQLINLQLLCQPCHDEKSRIDEIVYLPLRIYFNG